MDNNIDTIREKVEARAEAGEKEGSLAERFKSLRETGRMLLTAGKEAIEGKVKFIEDDVRKVAMGKLKQWNENKINKQNEAFNKDKTSYQDTIKNENTDPLVKQLLEGELANNEAKHKSTVESLEKKNGNINSALEEIETKEKGLREKIGGIFQPKLDKIEARKKNVLENVGDLRTLKNHYENACNGFEKQRDSIKLALEKHKSLSPETKDRLRDKLRVVNEALKENKKEASRYQKQFDRADRQLEKMAKSEVKWNALMHFVGGRKEEKKAGETQESQEQTESSAETGAETEKSWSLEEFSKIIQRYNTFSTKESKDLKINPLHFTRYLQKKNIKTINKENIGEIMMPYLTQRHFIASTAMNVAGGEMTGQFGLDIPDAKKVLDGIRKYL